MFLVFFIWLLLTPSKEKGSILYLLSTDQNLPTKQTRNVIKSIP